MIRIWVVEDVPDLLEDLCLQLREAGYEAEGLRDGLALRQHLTRKVPDIALLDVGLPGENGLQLARWLRAHFPHVGLVMLTGRALQQDRLAGLESGADAYLTKPVQPQELLLVLRNLSLRLNLPGNDAAWRLDTRALRLVHASGQSVALTAAEMHIMRALAGSQPHQASRRRLVEAMGQEWESYDARRLEATISRLRHKLVGQFDLAESPLRSLRGEGYAFVETVRLA